VKAASGLPDKVGATLLDSAQQAFTRGLHAAAFICAGLMLVLAILTGILLNDVRSGHEPLEERETGS
jgi:hypothetical protein